MVCSFAALGNPNVAVKKQVFEILAAISVYSKDGYARALQVLDKFKVSVLCVIIIIIIYSLFFLSSFS